MQNHLARYFSLLVASLTALCSSANAQQGFSATSPFANEIYAFIMEDAVAPPTQCKSLFVGSSSIRFWVTIEDDLPNLDIVQRGFGGSQMEHVNLYFDLLVANHRPARIFLYEGENDINAGDAPETVLADLMTFLDKKDKALGDTPVYFISIKPSPARAADFDAQQKANALVRKLAKSRKDLAYIDVVDAMMEDGTPKDIFVFDSLHMNHDGYKLWAAEIDGALNSEALEPAQYCK